MVFQFINNIWGKTPLSSTALAIDEACRSQGIESKIYAEVYEPDQKGMIASLHELNLLEEDDIAILHFGFDGFDRIWEFLQVDCKKVLYFYGVFDPACFTGYETFAAEASINANKELRGAANKIDLALCASEWCQEELRERGSACKCAIAPPVIESADAPRRSTQMLERFQASGGHRILSYGPVVPNRCYEDVIRAFAYYRKTCDPAASLAIVGFYDERSRYYRQLMQYLDVLGLADVVFFEGDQDLLPQYCSESDVYLALSTFEDVFLGMVSAMRSCLPIITFDSISMRGIAGSAALYLKDKDPLSVASALELFARDSQVRKTFIELGKERQSLFSKEKAVEAILDHIGVQSSK